MARELAQVSRARMKEQVLEQLAAIEAELYALAIIGVLSSVIAAFYYLRIGYFMYFGEETEGLDTGSSPVLWGFLMASAAIMVLGVANFFGVEAWAATAAATLVN